jgi:hypothetical protein
VTYTTPLQTICVALIAGIEELDKKSFANSTKRPDIELTVHYIIMSGPSCAVGYDCGLTYFGNKF